MTDPEEPGAGGPGLARERTVLAWYRLGLAVAVCIAVLLRRVWPLHDTGQRVALALIAGAAIVWAVVLLVMGGPGSDRRLLPHVRLWLMSVGTVLLAVVAFVLTVFSTP